jgi:Tfp pilus assembly protein PilX
MKTKSIKGADAQRGIALFMAIFALMLLSAIAAGFMYLANTETAVNSNYRSAQQAYFGARAGLQEGRARITTGVGDLAVQANAMTMPIAAATTGGIYITNPTAGEAASAPWDFRDPYFDDTICKANFAGLALNFGAQNIRCSTVPANGQSPAGAWAVTVASQAANTGTASSLPFKWVRITLKSNRSGSPLVAGAAYPASYPYQVDSTATVADDRQVCWNGTQQQLLPLAGYLNCSTPTGNADPLRPVFLLTSMSRMPSGSERTLSMEVADDPPTIVHGAVVSNDVIDTVGSSAGFIGSDNCRCRCTSAGVCTNRVGGGACSSGYSAITTSQTISSSGHPTITAPTTTPATPTTQTGVSPFPYDIPSLINRYKTAGGTVNASTTAPYNLSCTGSLTSTPPTANCGTVNGGSWGTAPTNFGTLQTDGTPVGNVNQTTYVPGNLDLQAHNSGSGILIVDGDLVVHGGIQFYGLIIVKGAVTFTGGGGGGGSNIMGALLAGQSAQADTLGGSAQFQFDQCALANAQNGQPPRMLSSREIEY